MFLKISIVLILPALAFAQVNLQPYNETAYVMFTLNDINGDGIYSLEEIHTFFMGFDVNGDGGVSRHEYTSHVLENSPELYDFSHGLYDIYDVDGDHHLDEHDFQNFHSLMDGDGDGDVTEHEYVRYWTIVLEQLEHLHGGGK